MDSINDGEEDNISNMPDDIIHHILSFLDTKYAVQFCILSHKWKNIWTSLRHLNFNNDTFSSISKFDKFMEDALSDRNDQIEVCAVKLRFTGEKILDAVIDTVDYAYLHNVKQLTIECNVYELPPCLFSSPTLKHLSLSSSTYTKSRVIDSAWNMPALETLYLRDIRFGDTGDTSFNLFHECVKLTSLTLEKCSMYDLKIFYICAPNLLNLTITRTSIFPEVFHVFAPQLETLKAGGYSSSYKFLKLSTEEGFSSLEKVNLSLSSNLQKRERHVPSLLDLLKKVSSAKSLILDVNITEMLSSSMDELSHKPCPFNNLKCLKINTATWKGKDNIPTMTPQVRNYLLRNSPNAIFSMHLPPKVTKLEAEEKKTENLAEEKRMLEAKLQKQNQHISYQAKLQTLNQHEPHMHDQLNAKKKTMFEAQRRTQDQPVSNKNVLFGTKIQTRDQIIAQKNAKIAKLKASLGTRNLQLVKLISHIINGKMTEVKVQLANGNPDYQVICSRARDIRSIMDKVSGSLRVKAESRFSDQYEQVKSQFFTRISSSQWTEIETQLGLIRYSDRAKFNNVHNQSHAYAAELHGAPRPSLGKINMAPLKQRDRIPTFPIQVGNCSLEKSPNATFAMDSPLQVPQKRSRDQLPDDTMVNKVPKLDVEKVQPETITDENRILREKLQMQEQLIAKYKGIFRSKIQMQDQNIAKEKALSMEKIQMQEQLIATLGAQDLYHEKSTAHIFKCKIAELQVQVKSGNPDYNIIRSMSSEIKSVMDLIHGSLRVDMEAEFSSQYEQVKSMLYDRIEAIQWAMIETELGLITHFGRIRFNNINNQSHVRATELPRPPRPSLANVASSSKSVWTGSNNWVI